MVKKADVPRHIIDTAMALAARKGWRNMMMADIAAEAKLSLADIYRVFPTKADILNGLARQIDVEVLSEDLDEVPEESARDRLFDVLMRRFDVLMPYKDALTVIVRDLRGDPMACFGSAAQFSRSMRWMLQAAGIDADGPAGLVRTSGLGLVWLQTLQVWLKDDSADMARTMAALDRHLRRAERIAGTLHRRERRFEDRPSPGETAAAG